ncbi:MAG: hypothetical protein FWC59_01105 [Actinomycetia bacterium]|nr:hypothetical protein [Actinomycetes bacterium]
MSKATTDKLVKLAALLWLILIPLLLLLQYVRVSLQTVSQALHIWQDLSLDGWPALFPGLLLLLVGLLGLSGYGFRHSRRSELDTPSNPAASAVGQPPVPPWSRWQVAVDCSLLTYFLAYLLRAILQSIVLPDSGTLTIILAYALAILSMLQVILLVLLLVFQLLATWRDWHRRTPWRVMGLLLSGIFALLLLNFFIGNRLELYFLQYSRDFYYIGVVAGRNLLVGYLLSLVVILRGCWAWEYLRRMLPDPQAVVLTGAAEIKYVLAITVSLLSALALACAAALLGVFL